MSKTNILDPKKTYTFSKYAEMPFATEDILAEFGVGFKNVALQLPSLSPISSAALKTELEENMAIVGSTATMLQRASKIFPVLKTVCKFSQTQFKIEYPVRVSNWLRGSFDYFLPFAKNLVVIEAKNADIARGSAIPNSKTTLAAHPRMNCGLTPKVPSGLICGGDWPRSKRFD